MPQKKKILKKKKERERERKRERERERERERAILGPKPGAAPAAAKPAKKKNNLKYIKYTKSSGLVFILLFIFFVTIF